MKNKMSNITVRLSGLPVCEMIEDEILNISCMSDIKTLSDIPGSIPLDPKEFLDNTAYAVHQGDLFLTSSIARCKAFSLDFLERLVDETEERIEWILRTLRASSDCHGDNC